MTDVVSGMGRMLAFVFLRLAPAKEVHKNLEFAKILRSRQGKEREHYRLVTLGPVVRMVNVLR